MKKEKKVVLMKEVKRGILVAILWSIVMAFVKPGSLLEFGAFNLNWFITYLISGLIAFPVLSYFWGLWIWNRKKKLEKK